MVQHESNKWHLKPLLHYSSAPKQNIQDSIMRHSHWNVENREALIPGPLSSARCSGLLFNASSQASTVNAHINLKDPSSKLTQKHSCSPQSCVNPPCSAPWGCRTAVSSGTGHLNPSSDQYKATSYSRTQAEQLLPWTLQLFIMGAKLHKPFPTIQACPTLFVIFSAWSISPSCADQGPDPSAQTRQTPHKLKLYKLWCANLQMHLREGLGRAPTVIFSLMSRATQSFWAQYS